jgi:hypothetical protein
MRCYKRRAWIQRHEHHTHSQNTVNLNRAQILLILEDNNNPLNEGYPYKNSDVFPRDSTNILNIKV